jgi:hypothetical protein
MCRGLPPFVPAKAGTQRFGQKLDSRFRGNERMSPQNTILTLFLSSANEHPPCSHRASSRVTLRWRSKGRCADNARRRVERREALPPPSMGARAPEAAAPGNRVPAVGARRAPSTPAKGRCASALAPPGAPFPFFGEPEKGNDGAPGAVKNTGDDAWPVGNRTGDRNRVRYFRRHPRARPARPCRRRSEPRFSHRAHLN